MKLMKERKAFTIVEMVIVIAVIAILATVLVPTISGVIDKANHSADQQFVASLNIQLALWQVDNGQIANESDLRVAINSYYGEEGEDFYGSLAPKSANRGYHFWFSAADQQVVLAKYEDLLVEDAPIAEVEPTFSPASPRSLIIGQKNYFLMDQSGSAIVDNLRAIESVDGNGAYGLAVAQLAATEAETDLAALIAFRLQNIAISNSYGVFFSEDWAGPVSYVYVPYGTETLGASKIPAGKTIEVSEIILPDTLTQIGTGSLLGFKLVPDDGLYVGSTTIFANVKEAQLSAFVATDSFDCVLEISTGERFAFVDGQLKKLGTNETIDTEYSVELQSFVVSAPADGNKKYDLHAWADGSNPVIHYTSDFAGSVTLTAGNFLDVNGDSASRTASWTVGGETIKGNTLTLTKTDLDANTQITVSAQNLTYTIDILKVAIDSFTASIGGVNGEPHAGDDGYAYYTATLEYKNGSSWVVNAQVDLAPVVSCVSMSNATTIEVSGTGASNLIVDGTSLKVKDGVNGTFEATVTITTVGADENGKQNSIKYVLTFNKASATFDIADNADTQDNYGLKFTVGTVQSIKLGTLFKLEEGTPSDIKVRLLNNGSGNEMTISKTGSDWTEWEITPSGNGSTYAIEISDGGAPCTLYVRIVSGAYNVENVAEWKQVGNKVSIVLLGTVDLNGQSDLEVSLKDSVTMGNNDNYSGSGWYSKNLGNKTIFGNYNKIIIPDSFKIKSEVGKGSNNYFLYMAGGALNNLIIDGPGFTESSNVYSSTEGTFGIGADMVAAHGYYVAGVEMAGGTINNCYISGFRSPVRVDGGTVNITGTTFVGGAFANIYVAKIGGTSTITLDNVNTIQWENLKGIVGAGIFFDASTGNVTLNLKNNTVQYNWAYNGGSYTGYAAQIVNQFFGKVGGCGDNKDNYYYAAMIHRIGDKDCASTGIIFESSVSYITVNTSNLSDSIPEYITDEGTRMTYSKWDVYNYKDCSETEACTHDFFPDENGDGKYTINDFLKAMEK